MLQEPLAQGLTPNLIEAAACIVKNDDALVMQLANEDATAFAQIISQHQDGLVNYLNHLCRCRDRAEDLAQESFIRLYRAIRKNPERDWQIRAYLYRIAVNLLCSQERRHKNFKKLNHFFRNHQQASQPQELLLQQETQTVVTNAIAKLPLRFRVPLVLREIEGWRVGDISKCLNLNEGTVKSRIHRGKQRLKTLLKGYWQGETP